MIKAGTAIVKNRLVRAADATGSPITGLLHSEVTVQVHIDGGNPISLPALVPGTIGVATSGGWVETSVAGSYQYGIPIAVYAQGGEQADLIFSDATGVIFRASILITAIDVQDAARGGMTALSDVVTVTDKIDTMLELDGAVYRYYANALELAPTGGGGGGGTVVFGPAVSVIDPGGIVESRFELQTGATQTRRFVIADVTGAPVNMAGRNLRLVIEDRRTRADALVIDDDAITIGGDDSNEITIVITKSQVPANLAGIYNFALVELDDNETAWAIGSCRIRYVPRQDAE